MSKVRGYVLSYQARTSLYEKLDVKRKIVEILVDKDATNINSYTDSTIYFENLVLDSENGAAKWRDILQKAFYVEDLTKGINYTLALCALDQNGKILFWDKYQDQILNERFKIMVKEIRKELKKPEP